MSRALLVAGVLIPLAALLPELLYLVPDVNDGAFHLGTVQNTIAAIGEGANPIDFWVPTWLCGFPLFHYYQPGPYLLVTLLHALFGPFVSLLALYRATTIVAVSLFPLTTYRALRWLELPRETAAWGAFVSCLISAGGTYGIELFSFTWAGWGLFAQAVSLPLLPLAVAGGWRAVHSRRRTLGYSALLFAAFMTHILYGYIATVSLALAPFMVRGAAEIRRRLMGLARFYAQAGALVAFFVVPLMLHAAYHAKSLYDGASKFDSYGARVILTRLLTGALLDTNRLPVLTCLAAAGLYLCGRRWLEDGSPVHGWIGCSFIFWTLLYFGRPTWGSLVDLLPMSKGLHFERLSSGVHLFAIWLAAITLGSLSRWCLGFESRRSRLLLGLAICGVLVAPILNERIRYFISSTQIVRNGQRAYATEFTDFAPILRRLHAEPPGRVYAGHSADWGHNYKVGPIYVYQLLSADAVPHLGNAPFSWPLPTDFQYEFNPSDKPSYDLYDVRYVLTDQAWIAPPGGELLLQSGKHFLYRVPAEGPFRLVSVPLTVVGDKESTWYLTKSWTKSAWPAQHGHVRLLFNEHEVQEGLGALRMLDPFHYLPASDESGTPQDLFDPPGLFASSPPPAPEGSLSDISRARQDAEVRVDSPAGAVLLFKTTYHPGWRASIDGVAAPTMLLTPGFIGLQVPAGRHQVHFFYRSGWMKGGLLIAGVLVALGLDWPRRGVASVT